MVLISCAVTAQLICTFVFAYAKLLSSHDIAQLLLLLLLLLLLSVAIILMEWQLWCLIIWNLVMCCILSIIEHLSHLNWIASGSSVSKRLKWIIIVFDVFMFLDVLIFQ